MLKSNEIGAKIKAQRNRQHMTLKALSEATNLSVGFLSQFERGMSSIAIDSLEKIAGALGLSLSDFFTQTTDPEDAGHPVIRSYDVRPNCINPRIYQYVLSGDVNDYDLLPRLFLLMPMNEEEKIELYSHNGEEFLYVLEGVVTLFYASEKYTLYPGDCAQIHSERPHNWINLTNNAVRILTINTPNPFHTAADGEHPRI